MYVCVCITYNYLLIVVVQLPSCVQLFAASCTVACQASLSLIVSQSLPKFMSTALVMPSNHLILWCLLLLCLQSFPASGTFPMSWSFTSDDQDIGVSASASVLPTCIHSWFPLRLSGLISLLSRICLKVMETNWPWNWGLTSPKNNKTRLVRSPHDQFQDNGQSWLCCLWM